MKKCIFLFISCFIVVFLSLSTGICQPVITNSSFDGTTTGWTNCSAGTPELNYSSECYDISQNQSTCVQYSACTTGCAANPTPDYLAEVDQGNSPGLCLSVVGFRDRMQSARENEAHRALAV